jgi:hypothetical protein
MVLLFCRCRVQCGLEYDLAIYLARGPYTMLHAQAFKLLWLLGEWQLHLQVRLAQLYNSLLELH